MTLNRFHPDSVPDVFTYGGFPGTECRTESALTIYGLLVRPLSRWTDTSESGFAIHLVVNRARR